MVKVSPLAGKLVDVSRLLDVPRLITAYFTEQPDPAVPSQRVSFGTSGHRGSSFNRSFNEAHILAISQAICRYRRSAGIDGPLFIGIDTHALSRPALANALEVFAANEVQAFVDEHDGYTPTPVISHAILAYNHGRTSGMADGVVITPSHNPPEDGGYKYNPPHGGLPKRLSPRRSSNSPMSTSNHLPISVACRIIARLLRLTSIAMTLSGRTFRISAASWTWMSSARPE